MIKNRYALLTVDTEALPKRAAQDHVQRLIWGKSSTGTAGIEQMCAIGDTFGAKHTFFVDMCATYEKYHDEVCHVVQWLEEQGQDVQLHMHPEYLPQSFWEKANLPTRPKLMNTYEYPKALYAINFFSKLMAETKQSPVRAFRAGSFRWNEETLKALKECHIPLSFNNCMWAYTEKKCPHSLPQNTPYQWSNGIFEIPITEQRFFFDSKQWGRLQFPESPLLRLMPQWLSFLPNSLKRNNLFVVLLHSWSFLQWDKNAFAAYKNAQRMDDYHSFLQRLSKDYDIITTAQLLDLLQSGKITTTHTEDITNAAYKAAR